MSLEKAIADLTVALQENTAALKGGAASAAAAPAATSSKPKSAPAPAPDASKHTRVEMTAALGEVKDKKSTAAAKTIIKDVGGADKMGDIPDSKIDAVYDAAKALIAEDDGL